MATPFLLFHLDSITLVCLSECEDHNARARTRAQRRGQVRPRRGAAEDGLLQHVHRAAVARLYCPRIHPVPLPAPNTHHRKLSRRERRVAKEVIGPSIRRLHIGLLRPGGPAAGERIDRAAVGRAIVVPGFIPVPLPASKYAPTARVSPARARLAPKASLAPVFDGFT